MIEDKKLLIEKLSNEDDVLNLLDDNSEYKVLYRMFIELLRCIFWVYRKSVVDSAIGDSIREVTRSKFRVAALQVMLGMGGVDAISVGSTRLVSDYDVTLYGNFKLMSEVIGEFNRVVEDIYGNSSEVIFDTNVYGTSFIKLSGRVIFDGEEDKNLYKEGNVCKGVNLSYVLGGSKEDVIDMQHVWAFIKVLKALKMIEKFDVRLYTSLYKYMELKLTNGGRRYLSKAGSFMSFLNKRRDYVGLLGSYEKLTSSLPDTDRVLLTNMYISLVNYYGSETYFTRGAFLDIVVNQQMCGGVIKRCEKSAGINQSNDESKDDIGVVLNRSELMDSIIENIGEVMMHVNRVKYTDRVESAIKDLGAIKDLSAIEYCKVLSELRDIQRVCNEDILKCGVYVMLHRCVELLVVCFNEYMENRGERDLSFGIFKSVRGVI